MGPEVQVKVVGDSKAPPELGQEAASSAEQVPALPGIPDPPTTEIESRQQPEAAKSQLAEQQSKSEAASGPAQHQSPGTEIAHISNSSDAARVAASENVTAPALGSLPPLSPSHQ